MEGSDPKPDEVNMRHPERAWPNRHALSMHPLREQSPGHAISSQPVPWCSCQSCSAGAEIRTRAAGDGRRAPGVEGSAAATDTRVNASAPMQFARRMVKRKIAAGEFLQTSPPAIPSQSHRQEGLEPVPSAAGMKEKLHINLRCFAELGMGRWF